MVQLPAEAKRFDMSSERSAESHRYLDEVRWNHISDQELLGILLSIASPEKDAKRRAASVLETVGSLNQLIHFPANQLRNIVPGNPDALTFINLLRLGMHRVINERTSDQIRINSPKALIEYVAANRNPKASGKRNAVLLDRDSRLISDFSMPMSQSEVAVCRSIAQEALRTDAFGLIVVDYLYGNNPRFSTKTESLCQKIETAMNNINVNVYDYLVVGTDHFCSMTTKQVVCL